MLIYVRCVTYGYTGDARGHLFNLNKNDTLQSLKDKIVTHFQSSENIHMFDDSTEQLIDLFESPLSDCFSASSAPFYSITFAEF